MSSIFDNRCRNTCQAAGWLTFTNTKKPVELSLIAQIMTAFVFNNTLPEDQDINLKGIKTRRRKEKSTSSDGSSVSTYYHNHRPQFNSPNAEDRVGVCLAE